MARWYQLHETQETRKEWENEQKRKDPRFHVCMHMTSKQVKKEGIWIDEETIKQLKYATIYTFR